MYDFDALLARCRAKRRKKIARIALAVAAVAAALGGLQWYMLERGVSLKSAPAQPETAAVRPLRSQPVAEETPAGKVTPADQKRAPKAQNAPAAVPNASTRPDGLPRPKKPTAPKPASGTSAPASRPSAKVTVPSAAMADAPRAGHREKPQAEQWVDVLQFVTTKKRYRAAALRRKRALERLGMACYVKDSSDGEHIYLRCLLPKARMAEVAAALRQKGVDFFTTAERREDLVALGLEEALAKAALVIEGVGPAVKRSRRGPQPKTQKSPTPSLVPLRKPSQAASRTPSAPPASVRQRVEAPRLQVRSADNIDDLKARFKRHPDYATALRIAELYFEKGRYGDASRWARRANRLDRDDERAWIAYARAEYAMGRRERAKRILRLYLEFKDSAKVRALLTEWRTK